MQWATHGRHTIYDSTWILFHAETAEQIGTPADQSESDRIEWIPLTEIHDCIAKGGIVSGPTLIGLLLRGG
jgi:hypothetical protein